MFAESALADKAAGTEVEANSGRFRELFETYQPALRRLVSAYVANPADREDGNVRQWILAPIGGIANTRDRDAEFAERRQQDKARLRAALDETLNEFDRILAGLTPPDLLKTYTIQRYGGITALAAIYHVVEHFGMHCGQILYITKLLSGTDLGFYRQLTGWGRVP